MKYPKERKKRRLKVQEVGDFWNNRTIPRIRLQGKWLADAGIDPNTYVIVDNPKPGTLVIRREALEDRS